MRVIIVQETFLLPLPDVAFKDVKRPLCRVRLLSFEFSLVFLLDRGSKYTREFMLETFILTIPLKI